MVTGGPCTGKTTLLNKLSDYGFATVPESARQIIEEEQIKETGILPWTDFIGFQYKVLDRQRENEDNVSKHEIVFLDRGLPDGLAYLNSEGLIPNNDLYNDLTAVNYSKVFVLDQIPIYENDSVRKETSDDAKIIHEHICKVYEELNFDIVYVPNMGKTERLNFVLEEIAKEKLNSESYKILELEGVINGMY